MEAINRSRQIIFEKIRRATLTGGINDGLSQQPLVGTKSEANETSYNRFTESLKMAGAEIAVLNICDIDTYISEKFPGAIDLRNKNIWEDYKGLQPSELANRAECVVISGKIGVAENGAIWVDDTCFPERLLPFIAGKLILLIGEDKIVSDMHEAYAAISGTLSGYGVFISGPSKTADIEQSLVYGAHGAISLDVVIMKG
ncbi:MAG: LUD domain-containing protein [Bacteroidales bacterium]|nr:LUD domain-containing protein [Bacteroidales bacterium]